MKIKPENYRVNQGIGDIETHHVFLDILAHKKEEEFGLSEKKFEVAIKARVIIAIFGLFFLCAGGLFAKTYYLQTVEGNSLRALAEGNKGRISFILPERGIIYDKHFKKLVSNAPAFDLVCDTRTFSLGNAQYQQEIARLSAVLQKPLEELQALFTQSDETKILLAESLSHENLLVLETAMHELPDCAIEQNTVRNYAMGPIFSHVLGYTGKTSKEDIKSNPGYILSEITGKTGIEKYYQRELRGTPGRLEIKKTATGVVKGDKVISNPSAGYNMVLNIDAGLQQTTYDALEKSIKNIGSKKGAAVALDPRTGAVLALVSYPAYDNNIFSQGISQVDYQKLVDDPNQPFFNRTIAAKYPTGSTIKPFLASGALQENLISPAKIINDPGYIIVHSQNDPSVIYKFAGVVPHGDVDMRKALAVSSNIYFYTVGGGYGSQKGLGPSGIKKYLDMYGWEQRTGIDLPGEFGGFVPSPTWKKEKKNESWWDGDTYNLSIGQSDLQVTPLQVATAYAAIANGGTLYRPQIVQKVVEGSPSTISTGSPQASSGSRIVREFKPEITGQLSIDQKNLQVVREGMRDGVVKPYGSSHMLNSLPVSVAGKTGTAETGRDGVYNTWSSNFAPYENPEIVFVATIEGVEGLRSATLPVAREVLEYYFSRK